MNLIWQKSVIVRNQLLLLAMVKGGSKHLLRLVKGKLEKPAKTRIDSDSFTKEYCRKENMRKLGI